MDILEGPSYLMRSLLGSATASADGEECHCFPPFYHGSPAEAVLLKVMLWINFAVCLGLLAFYCYDYYKATCGWEEVYVCTIEAIAVLLELFAEHYSPVSLTLTNGIHVNMVRYCLWVLTCPVLLIHLSNLTGLKDDYGKGTMALLVCLLGCLVTGIMAALSRGGTKIVLYIISCLYSIHIYYGAGKLYLQTFYVVPKGECRVVVKVMAWCFFISWFSYPILFIMGPEGMHALSMKASIIAHCFGDLLAKNLWGYLGHVLRIKIHEHILIHGDIRVKTKVMLGREEVEVEEFVSDESEDGAVKHSMKDLVKRRPSFMLMRENMKAQGMPVMESFDFRRTLDAVLNQQGDNLDHGADSMAMITLGAAGAGKGKAAAAAAPAGLEPARVILGAFDNGMVEHFKQQFAASPVEVELLVAVGADAVLAMANQSEAFGGADMVLLHPEYLRDNSTSGLVARLRAAGHRVVAFGWSQNDGYVRDLVENAGLDGWVQGPTWDTPLKIQQLLQVLAQIQGQRRRAPGPAVVMQSGLYKSGGGQPRSPSKGYIPRSTTPSSHKLQMSNETNPVGPDQVMLEKLMDEILRLKAKLGSDD